MNFSVRSIAKWRRPTTQYCKRIYYGQEKFTAGRSVPPSLRNRSRSSRKSILAASTLPCDPHVYSNNGIFLQNNLIQSPHNDDQGFVNETGACLRFPFDNRLLFYETFSNTIGKCVKETPKTKFVNIQYINIIMWRFRFQLPGFFRHRYIIKRTTKKNTRNLTKNIMFPSLNKNFK